MMSKWTSHITYRCALCNPASQNLIEFMDLLRKYFENHPLIFVSLFIVPGLVVAINGEMSMCVCVCVTVWPGAVLL